MSGLSWKVRDLSRLLSRSLGRASGPKDGEIAKSCRKPFNPGRRATPWTHFHANLPKRYFWVVGQFAQRQVLVGQALLPVCASCGDIVPDRRECLSYQAN